MKKDYTEVSIENSTAVEDVKESEHLMKSEKHRTFNASAWSFPLLLLLFMYPYNDKMQSAVPPPADGCGAQTSVLFAGDSLMIAHQLLTGATNYALKIHRRDAGGWMQPTGDVASGCSRLSYFVLYLKDKPNQCQKFVLKPGDYDYMITVYNNLIADSCVMEGSFYLSSEQVWKATYSSWDLVNTQYAPMLKK